MNISPTEDWKMRINSFPKNSQAIGKARRGYLALATHCFSFISGIFSITAIVFCHHSIFFLMFSLSSGLLKARRMFLNITGYNKQNFESVVTAYLSQSSSNTGFITISSSSLLLFFFLIPTHAHKCTSISSLLFLVDN